METSTAKLEEVAEKDAGTDEEVEEEEAGMGEGVDGHFQFVCPRHSPPDPAAVVPKDGAGSGAGAANKDRQGVMRFPRTN